MRNIKAEEKLIGNKFWPHIASIMVKGISTNTEIPNNLSTEAKEEIIQSWDNIAVLRIKSSSPAKFYFGFTNLGIIQYLKYEFSTDTEIGARVGPDDIRIFALSLDLNDEIEIELVEITNEKNEKYNDLKLI